MRVDCAFLYLVLVSARLQLLCVHHMPVLALLGHMFNNMARLWRYSLLAAMRPPLSITTGEKCSRPAAVQVGCMFSSIIRYSAGRVLEILSQKWHSTAKSPSDEEMTRHQNLERIVTWLLYVTLYFHSHSPILITVGFSAIQTAKAALMIACSCLFRE